MSSTAHRTADDGASEPGGRAGAPRRRAGARKTPTERTGRKSRASRPDQADHGDRGRRPPGRRDGRRTLRTEAPTVFGLIRDDTAFTAMTERYGYPFDDYAAYLREVDRFLRCLDSGGAHVRVTLFDPEDYADYCASTQQAADASATRARYVAEATTTGPGVRYMRQPLDRLRDELGREAARRATWEAATDLLLDAGPCADCGQDLAQCAFDQVSQTLLRIVDVLGPGRHHAVASLPADDGPPLTAAVTIEAHEDGSVHFAEPDALILCTVMAATAAVSHPAGLAVRTTTADGAETVRGWSLRNTEPRPLTEAQVFDAYCTDPATGEPVSPEPGLRYAAGFPLPPEPPADAD